MELGEPGPGVGAGLPGSTMCHTRRHPETPEPARCSGAGQGVPPAGLCSKGCLTTACHMTVLRVTL